MCAVCQQLAEVQTPAPVVAVERIDKAVIVQPDGSRYEFERIA
jgi:hypothetical protein